MRHFAQFLALLALLATIVAGLDRTSLLWLAVMLLCLLEVLDRVTL